jgi:hypothetical protein
MGSSNGDALRGLAGFSGDSISGRGMNPKGAREDASGVFVRLVSLWWEFPPWLDSNNNIWKFGMQQFFVEIF